MPTVSDFTALLSGSSWTAEAGTPTVLTFSFASGEYHPGVYLDSTLPLSDEMFFSMQAFTEEQRNTTRQALDLWADASGLVFVELGTPGAVGDLYFANYDFSLDTGDTLTGDGFALHPARSLSQPWGETARIGGDVLIDSATMTEMPLALILHETGRALGLTHPSEGDVTHSPGVLDGHATIMALDFDISASQLGPLDRDAIGALYGDGSLDPEAAGIRNFSVDEVAFQATQAWGGGDSEIFGSSLDDVVSAGAGDDTVSGFEGADILRGEDGSDLLHGHLGADTLEGGNGADVLVGGSDNDELRGGAGNDTLHGDFFGGYPPLYGAAFPAFGGSDSLFGDAGSDVLRGGDYDDLLVGGDGDDTLEGGEGADTLEGGSGADSFIGGPGDLAGWEIDTASFANAGGRVLVDLQQDVSEAVFAKFFEEGAPEGDTFTAIDALIGSRFSDNLRGDAAWNILEGGAGWDRLYGRAGNDEIHGGGGTDAIYGNLGADVMSGGTQAQRDRYIYFSAAESGVGASARDVIIDFQPGIDRIEISRLDADTTQGHKQAFDFIGDAAFTSAGQLGYRHDGGNTIVQADFDGDGAADFEIELTGVMDVTEADFLI
ncbi:M10 family metallopeptidase C-terminal domain-containing protein [Salipiger mucosus]|uniref:Alkaline phosphatase n=1 Tax=Salipiger mucosus DSM 16094 TaxID=1123237 RepID=S9QV35_9RHOB|nr:M10 family metallopeptidase C-terminal domain-containing protein [Salipiger mucosus]EPX83473.1 Alkaline phosphatase [Salipiger mucosus DSM 16094]